MTQATTEGRVRDEIDHGIGTFRRLQARRYRLARAASDILEEITWLDETISDAEADLAVQLKGGGPRVLEDREYRHVLRDGCDCVDVRNI